MIRLKIKRVFNNNVVLVYKDDDEAVIFGKGIGFQKKHGDTLDETKIGKIFTTNKKQSSNFETLFNEISTEYVDLTYKIVEQAESDLNIEFNSSIYIAVMDHINYALVRAQDNLFIKNDLIWEIQRTYPKDVYKRQRQRQVILSKVGIYKKLEDIPIVTQEFITKCEKNGNEHEYIDNNLLYTVYRNCVSYLITNDKGILKKSEKLGLSDKVLTISKALSLLLSLIHI